MGSAASVKKYCEDMCCPEEVKLLEPLINDISDIKHEEDNNALIEQDNSDNNINSQSLFNLNNKDNSNNSQIIKENNKEKENENNSNNINNTNFNSDGNTFHKYNTIDKKEKHIVFGSPKKFKLNNSNTFSKDVQINSDLKSCLKIKQKTINACKKSKYNIENIDNNKYSQALIKEKIKQEKKKYISNTNIKKESEIKTNFEEENKQKNNKYLTLIQKNEESIFDTDVIKYNSSFLFGDLMETINISEESFRSVELKSNKFQNQIPKFAMKRPLDNDFIKGNFLMKKMKFKYQGNKDSEGKKLGFGIITYEDTSKIMGNFYDSKLNGVVYFYNCGLDNSTYIGEYINNIPNGYGIYSRQGLKLEGMNWNKNYINNIGIALWDEGDIYEGEFKNNLKEGIGTYRWDDGASYMGNFQNNQINGYGIMNFANGNSYVGEFSDGYLSGWGKFTWEDGKCYIGNYYQNKKNGFGIFISNFQPLIALIGFWENGKQEGVFVRLLNGNIKYLFYHSKNKIEEIGNAGDICRYLNSSQMKYKNFLKRSYNQLEHFIKSSTKY